MSEHGPCTKLSESVVSAITAGEVRMRPRWWFFARTALLCAGVLLGFLTLLYLVSLILFFLRQSGAGFAPAFGPRGWLSFARNLPWLLIVVATAFIVLVEMVVRRYQFAYRRPALYSALAVIGIAVLGGFALVETPLHARLSEYAREHRFAFGPYRHVEEYGLPDIYRGIIFATTSEGFILESNNGTTSVFIDAGTRLPLLFQLEPGFPVIVFGDQATGTIRAFGVKPLPMHKKGMK